MDLLLLHLCMQPLQYSISPELNSAYFPLSAPYEPVITPDIEQSISPSKLVANQPNITRLAQPGNGVPGKSPSGTTIAQPKTSADCVDG